VKEEAMMATIELRNDNLAKYRRMLGLSTDEALALRMQVNPATVSRVLRGKTSPGPRFIAGLLTAFNEYAVDFNDLFRVVADYDEDDVA
jgi:transcriptional regulator with XRE-family HTH domain